MLLDYSFLVKENGAITTQHVTASSPHSAKEQYKKAPSCRRDYVRPEGSDNSGQGYSKGD